MKVLETISRYYSIAIHHYCIDEQIRVGVGESD
jgi:hypothetical protein